MDVRMCATNRCAGVQKAEHCVRGGVLGHGWVAWVSPWTSVSVRPLTGRLSFMSLPDTRTASTAAREAQGRGGVYKGSGE